MSIEVKGSLQTVVTTTVKETTSKASEKVDDVKPVETSKEEVSVEPKKEDEPPVNKENNVPIKAINPHSTVSQNLLKDRQGQNEQRIQCK